VRTGLYNSGSLAVDSVDLPSRQCTPPPPHSSPPILASPGFFRLSCSLPRQPSIKMHVQVLDRPSALSGKSEYAG
jgi:hypothetical protein